MKTQTCFITGSEGVGKTTLLKNLKKQFPNMKVHDFDEQGVPDNPPLQWRLDTTEYWIRKAVEYQEKKKSTIIIGLCFPNEIKKSKDYQNLEAVRFILLDINKEERKKRLKKRGAAKEVIEDTDCFFELKKQFKDKEETIIDTSILSPKEVLGKIVILMEEKNGL